MCLEREVLCPLRTFIRNLVNLSILATALRHASVFENRRTSPQAEQDWKLTPSKPWVAGFPFAFPLEARQLWQQASSA
jgi:hypothetical protein